MTATTANLVRASAEVVTILTLRKGDVYRRLYKPAYAPERMVYGVVQSIDHNGTNAAITALEFGPDTAPERAVFGTTMELNLFATTVEEAQQAFRSIEEKAEASIKSKQRELDREMETLQAVYRVRDGLAAGSLQEAEVIKGETIAVQEATLLKELTGE